MVTLESLGKALKQLRDGKLMADGKSMTLMELEYLAGFDKGNLSKLERGKEGGGYSHDSLGRLADALGTSMSQIYALAEEIENGTATPDTVALVHAINSLPDDSRGAVQTLVASVAKSTAPWDRVKRRRTDRLRGSRAA